MGDAGVDGVSLRHICAAAGEKNTAAVQYHFGGKEGLLAAIFEHRMSHIDARRVARLDELEAVGGTADLRAVIEAAIYPLAEFVLEGGPEGCTYLLFLAQVHRHSQRRVMQAAWDAGAVGLQRVLALVERHLADLPPPVLRARTAMMLCYVLHALAEHAMTLRSGAAQGAEADTKFFVLNLVDTTVGLLEAPVSVKTTAQCRGETPAGHTGGGESHGTKSA